MTNSDLLVNLAFALGAATIGALIALVLRQSVILGYMLGGIAIGPYTPGFVGDAVAVEDLANIGVILLMFAIGVQLSVRDLVRAGPVAGIGASIQVVLTIGLGWLVALALGWSSVEGLFLGAVVSNSSSTVLSKVLGERGEMGSTHGQLALAWSTVQDLSTIVLVVVLTAVAEGGDDLAGELIWSAGRAFLFLVLLVPVGSRLLPWFFERVAVFRQREVFILTVGAVALGTAYVSSLFGLSLALGAFVAGVVVSESDLSHQILGEIIPLRDIFAGLFFVSVGMLVDPVFVANNIPMVLIVVLMIVIAKGTLSGVLTAAFRYPARTSVLTGVALAQSAEFSFLLARLGADLDAISSDVFNVMLAAAAISIVLAPLLHGLADPIVRRVEQILPPSELSRLSAPQEDTLRRHAVICGYGRVGRVIGEALQRRGFRYLVLEQDQAIVRRLREAGVPALLGSADSPVLLEQAHLEQARVLIVAAPDGLAARRIVDFARAINPQLDIVVRTDSDEERAALRKLGATEALVGELELALEMTRFALHRYGVGSFEINAALQRVRRQHRFDPDNPDADSSDPPWRRTASSGTRRFPIPAPRLRSRRSRSSGS